MPLGKRFFIDFDELQSDGRKLAFAIMLAGLIAYLFENNTDGISAIIASSITYVFCIIKRRVGPYE